MRPCAFWLGDKISRPCLSQSGETKLTWTYFPAFKASCQQGLSALIAIGQSNSLGTRWRKPNETLSMRGEFKKLRNRVSGKLSATKILFIHWLKNSESICVQKVRLYKAHFVEIYWKLWHIFRPNSPTVPFKICITTLLVLFLFGALSVPLYNLVL